MKDAFRTRYSQAVAVLVPQKVRIAIIEEAVTRAEQAASHAGETAIFDVHEPVVLKVVVQFAKRCVWLLTPEEAVASGLPDQSPPSLN